MPDTDAHPESYLPEYETRSIDSSLRSKSNSLPWLCQQAAIDRDKAAQSKAPKRPTFRRPTAKRPATTAPAEDPAAAKAAKKPRLDSLFQQGAAQPSLAPREGASKESGGGAQVWSPTQHTDLPYSPGKLHIGNALQVPCPTSAMSYTVCLEVLCKALSCALLQSIGVNCLDRAQPPVQCG